MSRVRLSLIPPFEPKKILLPLPKDAKTVSQLKTFLVQNLHAIAQHASSAKEIVLEVDGFELLSGSSLKVLEPTDVVCVRLAPGSSKTGTIHVKDEKGDRKRKPTVEKERDVKKRKTVASEKPEPSKTSVAPRRAPARSSSAALSATLSSSASPSSSDSTSSSSSSSSSSSTSDSSSSSEEEAPLPKPGAVTSPFVPPRPNITSQQVIPSVPPGQGKSQTQSRNARRRLARQYKKEAEAQLLVERSSNLPDSNHPSKHNDPTATGTTTFTSSELPIPKDMANRNKKRGFLKDMANVQGTKIVFEGDQQPVELFSDENATSRSGDQGRKEDSQKDWTMGGLPYGEEDESRPEITTSTPKARQWAVPPSEMTSLPSNIFVTRAEFGDQWYSNRDQGKRRRANGNQEDENDKAEEDEVEDEEEMKEVEEIGVNGGTLLGVPEGREEVVWEQAENNYDHLSVMSVGDVDRCQIGSFLVCKELELDMFTFSPELKIQLARVISKAEGIVNAEKLKRPVYDDDGGLMEPEEAPEDLEHVCITPAEVQSGKWRMLE